MLLAASSVHTPVFGSHSSAACTAVDRSLNPPPLVPPVARTSPSGRTVAFRCRRPWLMEPVLRQAGPLTLRSIVSAVAVGSLALGSLALVLRYPPPPTKMIFPVSYITAEP